MDDALDQVMPWLRNRPITYTLDDLFAVANGPTALSPRAQAAVDNIMGNQLWHPGMVQNTGRLTKISGAAATAPGSERRNDVSFFFEQFDQVAYSTYVAQAQAYMRSLWGESGLTITASGEDDDEEIKPGFEGTAQPDASAIPHKPGTPEHTNEVIDWIHREDKARARSGQFDHDAKRVVRDANLKRYAMTDADRLIEEMMK